MKLDGERKRTSEAGISGEGEDKQLQSGPSG